METNQTPQKEPIGDVLKKYKEMHKNGTLPSPDSVQSLPIDSPTSITPPNQPLETSIPSAASTFNPQEYENVMNKETDPDLMTSYEIVKLPSKGLFYQNRITELLVDSDLKSFFVGHE